MPTKRKSAQGVAGAVKRLKNATTRAKPIANQRALIPSLTQDDFDKITQKVTKEVTANLEKKLDSYFQKKATTEADDAVRANVETVSNNIQGTDEANDTLIVDDVISPEVLTDRPPQISVKNKTCGQSNFVSCSLTTGGNIPDKIKQNIWLGKFVDFRSLIDEDEVKFKFQFGKVGENNELSLVEERNKKSLSLNQWLTAWNKFTAIICTKTPDLGSQLPHHLDIILEMSRDGGNWQYYDTEFRKLIEKGEAQWGNTHLELFMRAKLQGRSNHTSTKNNNTRWPIGVCFTFHRGMSCKYGNSCRYQHKCFNCGFNHPFSSCKKPVSLPFKFTTHSSNNNNSNNSKQFSNFNQPFRGENRNTTGTRPNGQITIPDKPIGKTIDRK